MLSVPPSKPAKILPVNFYLLPHQYERTPKESEQLVHMQAGLGRKTMQMDENATYDEVAANVTELNSLVTLYRWNMGAEVLLSTLL